MRDLVQLALLAVEAMLSASPPPPRVRPWWRIAGAVSVGLNLLVAAGFALTALWQFLLPQVGAAGAALIIAGLALLKAICLALLLRYWGDPPAAKSSGPGIQVLLAQAEGLFKENKVSILVAALLAGAVAGSAGPDRR